MNRKSYSTPFNRAMFILWKMIIANRAHIALGIEDTCWTMQEITNMCEATRPTVRASVKMLVQWKMLSELQGSNAVEYRLTERGLDWYETNNAYVRECRQEHLEKIN